MTTQVTGCCFVQAPAAYIAQNHIYEFGLPSLRYKHATNTKVTAITISTGSPKLSPGTFLIAIDMNLGFLL